MTQNKKTTKKKTRSVKKEVLLEIFQHYKTSDNPIFDNDLVKSISGKRFKNHFDVTKTDNLSLLPESIREQGYCVVHLGGGRHAFIKAANDCFHDFEEIPSEEIPWKYRKSALNEIDTSESTILSVGFNQRIVHDFLYDDIVASPKMYGSRRTKITSDYFIGEEKISVEKLQIEMDLVTEYQGVVTVFEGKSGFPENFAVYQLFHPFLYFSQLKTEKEIKIDSINCCYMLRKKIKRDIVIRLYLYTFSDSSNMESIKLEKCAQYRLIKR